MRIFGFGTPSGYEALTASDNTLDGFADFLSPSNNWEERAADLATRVQESGWRQLRLLRRDMWATVQPMHQGHEQLDPYRNLLQALLSLCSSDYPERDLAVKYLMERLCTRSLQTIVSNEAFPVAALLELSGIFDSIGYDEWAIYPLIDDHRRTLARTFCVRYDQWKSELYTLSQYDHTHDRFAAQVGSLLRFVLLLPENIYPSRARAAAILFDAMPPDRELSALEPLNLWDYSVLAEHCVNRGALLALAHSQIKRNVSGRSSLRNEHLDIKLFSHVIPKLITGLGKGQQPLHLESLARVLHFLMDHSALLKLADGALYKLPSNVRSQLFDHIYTESMLQGLQPERFCDVANFLLHACPDDKRNQVAQTVIEVGKVDQASSVWELLTSPAPHLRWRWCLLATLLACALPEQVRGLKPEARSEFFERTTILPTSFLQHMMPDSLGLTTLLGGKLLLVDNGHPLSISSMKLLRDLEELEASDPTGYELLRPYFSQVPPFQLFMALQDRNLAPTVVRHLHLRTPIEVEVLLGVTPTYLLRYEAVQGCLATLDNAAVRRVMAKLPSESRDHMLQGPSARLREIMDAFRQTPAATRLTIGWGFEEQLIHRNNALREAQLLAPLWAAERDENDIAELSGQLRKLRMIEPEPEPHGEQPDADELPEYLMSMLKPWILEQMDTSRLYDLEAAGLRSDADLVKLGIDRQSYVAWEERRKICLTPLKSSDVHSIERKWRKGAMAADEQILIRQAKRIATIAQGDWQSIADLMRQFPPRVLNDYLAKS